MAEAVVTSEEVAEAVVTAEEVAEAVETAEEVAEAVVTSEEVAEAVVTVEEVAEAGVTSEEVAAATVREAAVDVTEVAPEMSVFGAMEVTNCFITLTGLGLRIFANVFGLFLTTAFPTMIFEDTLAFVTLLGLAEFLDKAEVNNADNVVAVEEEIDWMFDAVVVVVVVIVVVVVVVNADGTSSSSTIMGEFALPSSFLVGILVHFGPFGPLTSRSLVGPEMAPPNSVLRQMSLKTM